MIFGEGMRLRAADRDDLPMFVKWFNDPEVRHGLMMYLPLSMAKEEQWFEAMLKRPQDEHPLKKQALFRKAACVKLTTMMANTLMPY